ncbi:hypothetical protein IFM89_036585, partial [Coptis chinensis]
MVWGECRDEPRKLLVSFQHAVRSHSVTYFSYWKPVLKFPSPQIEGGELKSPNLKIFSLRELKAATRSFCPDNILGEGSFGLVYNGWIDQHKLTPTKLGTGMAVAGKIHKPESFPVRQEWLTEIYYLGKYYHSNLVRLIGYCFEVKCRGCHGAYKGWSDQHKLTPTKIWDAGLAVAVRINKSDSPFKGHREWLNYRAKLSGLGERRVSTRVMETFGYTAPEFVCT